MCRIVDNICAENSTSTSMRRGDNGDQCCCQCQCWLPCTMTSRNTQGNQHKDCNWSIDYRWNVRIASVNFLISLWIATDESTPIVMMLSPIGILRKFIFLSLFLGTSSVYWLSVPSSILVWVLKYIISRDLTLLVILLYEVTNALFYLIFYTIKWWQCNCSPDSQIWPKCNKPHVMNP